MSRMKFQAVVDYFLCFIKAPTEGISVSNIRELVSIQIKWFVFFFRRFVVGYEFV